MDGCQKKLTYSLQNKLSLSLSILILLMGFLSGWYNYFTTQQDAKEWQDDFLLQILHINEKSALNLLKNSSQVFTVSDEPDTNLYILKLAKDNEKVIIANHSFFNIKNNLADGLHTFNASDNNYRVAISTLATGEKLIVAQSTIERDELATGNAIRAILPIILIVPLMIFLIKKYLIHLFKPIAQTTTLINSTDYDNLSMISLLNLPREIHPFVAAINQLLIRISNYVSHQQRFIAEAAHELRSPLTALSLQAERLEKFPMSDKASTELKKLRAGIDRNRNLVAQLLTMARVQADQKQTVSTISLPFIVKTAIEDLMPLAERKNIDIGMVELQDIAICANEFELFTLFKNLLDNAIKYSRNNSVIDLSIKQ